MMTSKITESAIETFAIELLESQGYQYIYGPDIAPDSDTPERSSFDAAGIKKPDISVLSEDFLLEVKNMEQKNIALEVLKKLLNDEIKSRTKKNLIQSRSLMEMLESSIKKYHNKILTAAEVIEELINLSKEIHEMDKEPKAMGLSDYEYAFYTAIANNDSTKVKLKVIVKRILRQYGYPPDMQMLATETAPKQAELIAEELTHES